MVRPRRVLLVLSVNVRSIFRTVIALREASAHAEILFDLDLCSTHPRFGESICDVEQSVSQSLP